MSQSSGFAQLSLCVDGGRRFSPPIIVITEGSRTSFPGGVNPSGNPGYHSVFILATFPISRFLFQHLANMRTEISIRFQCSFLGFLPFLSVQGGHAG